MHGDREALARSLEHGAELRSVGDDERSRGGRGRGADVRREVAERGVLLVADGRDDRDARGGECADDGLVAPGQEILEAPAAPGRDDHVDLGVPVERAQRGDDLPRRALSLHARLADDDLRDREAARDGRDDVSARRRVRAGQDPDRARDPRERTLSLGGEEALGRESAFEELERDEVLAEPEPLDRRQPERELSPRLPDLRATLRVHGLALLEPELEAVEGAPLHGRLERRSGGGITEREEDRRPGLVPTQLGHLALHPDRRDASDVPGHAAVEGGDRVDLAVTVEDRLDLHRRSVQPPSRQLGRRRSVA